MSLTSHPTMYTADGVRICNSNRVSADLFKVQCVSARADKEGPCAWPLINSKRDTTSRERIHRRKPDPNGYHAEILLDIVITPCWKGNRGGSAEISTPLHQEPSFYYQEGITILLLGRTGDALSTNLTEQ